LPDNVKKSFETDMCVCVCVYIYTHTHTHIHTHTHTKALDALSQILAFMYFLYYV